MIVATFVFAIWKIIMMADRIFSGVMLLASLIFLYLAWGYTAPIAYDPIGPRPFPVIILGLLSLGTAVIAFRPARLSEKIEMGLTPNTIKNLVSCFVAMLLYAVLFEILGYIVATSLMAWAVGILFAGKVIQSLIASVCLAILTYLLFDKLLDVSLPLGVLSFLGN